jgi:hypothetical protein
MNDSGNLYKPFYRELNQNLPERAQQYAQFNNYNYRVTTMPNCVIGRRFSLPERHNDEGAWQPPGVPLHRFGQKDDLLHNTSGYVKPSYTKYG